MTSPWILGRRGRAAAELALVCLPHAGGDATAFHGLCAALPAWIEPLAVQLPGRGRRLREPALRRMDALVAALDAALDPLLGSRYAIFGTSLGALVAFEWARHRRRARRPGPVHLFVSACSAPEIVGARTPMHALPDAAFLAEITALGGIPPEVIADKELVRLVLPGLRADFELYETYRFDPGTPLDCPLTVIGGEADPYVDHRDLETWSTMTNASTALHRLPGGHFLLASSARALAQIVAARLAN